MNRGDVWMVDIGGRAGTRPGVVLTRQNVLNYLNKVTVAEVTTSGKGHPTEVFVDVKANLSRPSFVQADNIHTVVRTNPRRISGLPIIPTSTSTSPPLTLPGSTRSRYGSACFVG